MSINYIKYDAATDTQTDTVIFSGWDPFRTPPWQLPQDVCVYRWWGSVSNFLEIFRCLAIATAHVWTRHSHSSARVQTERLSRPHSFC